MTRGDRAYSFLAAGAAVAGGTLLAAKVGRSIRNHYKEKPLKKERVDLMKIKPANRTPLQVARIKELTNMLRYQTYPEEDHLIDKLGLVASMAD